MKKEDFKYEDLEKYISNKYVFEDKEYLLLISEEIFNEDTIRYANGIIKKYQKEKDFILNYLLEKGLRKFYNNYSDEYIKNNIGKPQISIDFAKDDNYPNWKFEYAGIIEFCESKIDEHIVSIDFVDNLKLDTNVQING